MKSFFNTVSEIDVKMRVALIGVLLVILGTSCNKSKSPAKEGEIIVSETADKMEAIDEYKLSAEGENDTLYAFSANAIEIEISRGGDWLKIVSTEYLNGINATMIILKAEKLVDFFEERYAELTISNGFLYSRKFLTLTQGYEARLTEDFEWLHYGHGNPLNIDEGVLLKNWTPVQKDKGWTSQALEGMDDAYVFGRDGYVQVGDENVGANILSPIITGLQNDSILLLRFNAVSFVSKEGVSDDNKLTIKLDGAEFEDGSDAKTVSLGYMDNESALLATSMWNLSSYNFLIKKNELTPSSTNLQITFLSGDEKEMPKNRLFLDNVILYSKEKYTPLVVNN